MEAASAEEATGEGSTTEGAGAGDTMEALAKASHYVTHPLSGKLLYSRRRDGPLASLAVLPRLVEGRSLLWTGGLLRCVCPDGAAVYETMGTEHGRAVTFLPKGAVVDAKRKIVAGASEVWYELSMRGQKGNEMTGYVSAFKRSGDTDVLLMEPVPPAAGQGGGGGGGKGGGSGGYVDDGDGDGDVGATTPTDAAVRAALVQQVAAAVCEHGLRGHLGHWMDALLCVDASDDSLATLIAPGGGGGSSGGAVAMQSGDGSGSGSGSPNAGGDGSSNASRLSDTPGRWLGSLGNAGAAPVPCGYIFKPGDIAWNCRTCEVDSTCVQCDACFRRSDHEGHEVFFHRTTPGGCCDCGDEEAWADAGCCDLHRPRRAAEKEKKKKKKKKKRKQQKMVCQPCAPMDAEAGEDDENDEDDQEDDPILSLPPVLVATSPLVLAEAADFVLSTRVRTVEGFDLPKERQALLEELVASGACPAPRGEEFLEWKQKGRAAVVTTLEDLDELVSLVESDDDEQSRAAERAAETSESAASADRSPGQSWWSRLRGRSFDEERAAAAAAAAAAGEADATTTSSSSSSSSSSDGDGEGDSSMMKTDETNAGSSSTSGGYGSSSSSSDSLSSAAAARNTFDLCGGKVTSGVTKAKADEGRAPGRVSLRHWTERLRRELPPEAKSEEELFQWLTALLNGHPELSRVPKAQETSLRKVAAKMFPLQQGKTFSRVVD